MLLPEIRPAIEAVETMCPPSPCRSISGPKISMPQTTRHQVDAERQFQAASVQVPYGPLPPMPRC